MENKTSIISVEGLGCVEVEANILQMNITVSATTSSIKQSQEDVNKTVYSIVNILETNKVNKKYIHTSSINFYPEYTWEKNSRVFVGQKVDQTIICIIENLKNNINKAIVILDSIANNSNAISLNLNFLIKESREIKIKCRELAYLDGYEKAKRYAELAGLKIIKAIKIAENGRERSHYHDDNDVCNAIIGSDDSTPSQLQVGKIKKSMNLYIDFLAE